MTIIIQNKIQCNHCLDIIKSKHRHDYKLCSCGTVYIDGGKDYLRRGFKKDGDYIELSIEKEISTIMKEGETLTEEEKEDFFMWICSVVDVHTYNNNLEYKKGKISKEKKDNTNTFLQKRLEEARILTEQVQSL